jgi:large subunit ribosomal protein L24e
MVTKTDKCSFTEWKIVPGRGTRYVGRDGKVHYFISSKARSLFHQRIKPVKLTWTLAWRAFNKKVTTDFVQKKRTRKTTRVQKAIVGMTLDDIRRKREETREDRDKTNAKIAADIKDRKMKQMKSKQAEKAKVAKVAAPKGGKKDAAVKNVKTAAPRVGGKK